MRNLVQLALPLVLILITGCASSIEVTKTQNFDSDASITIVAKGQDPMGVQSKLEHHLLSKEFNIISEATAQKKITFQKETTTDSSSSKSEGEVSSI